eukprot:1343742-Amphidinium_carterae.1
MDLTEGQIGNVQEHLVSLEFFTGVEELFRWMPTAAESISKVLGMSWTCQGAKIMMATCQFTVGVGVVCFARQLRFRVVLAELFIEAERLCE